MEQQSEGNLEFEMNEILKRHDLVESNIIPILQDVQERYRYLPKRAISIIADAVGLSENVIYGVATFYAQFRFNKPGRYEIKACVGTACHVRGGKRILKALENRLGIKHGETTDDGLFSIDTVACMGCCALAPVLVVDDEVFGSSTPTKVDGIITKCEEED